LNLAITGDQLLPRISSNVSVHPTEPAADPLADWLASCEKLLRELPEDCLILPAHNEPFTGAHTRLRALVDGHHTALRRLVQKLEKGPVRVTDTFVTLFGRAIGEDDMGSATGEAIAHLNYLIRRGEVRAAPDADGVLLYQLA
jgi:glyoxylase-like metal-dependent hydrolase (beta-lactamase superfamily II)